MPETIAPQEKVEIATMQSNETKIRRIRKINDIIAYLLALPILIIVTIGWIYSTYVEPFDVITFTIIMFVAYLFLFVVAKTIIASRLVSLGDI